MEMTYGGAMVLPRNYVLMDDDEMTYLEGGGTIRVTASASTVRTICRAGVALISAAIGIVMGTGLASLFISAFAVIVYDFIIDICNVQYKAINKSWTADWLPTKTFNLNEYV